MLANITKKTVQVLILYFLCLTSNGQVNQKYLIKYLTSGTLASITNVREIVQDPYGFIWIATQDGLFRFNGKGFEVIKNNAGITNSTIGRHISGATGGDTCPTNGRG